MKYLFGKPISRFLFPEQNNKSIALQSQNPTIFVYSSLPSRNDVITGVGALASAVTTGTQDASEPYTCSYTLAAIADPNPTSSVWLATYYESIKFKADTSAAEYQYLIRSFELERLGFPDSIPLVGVQDLKNTYPNIYKYLSDPELEEMIGIALSSIKLDLKTKDLNWSDLGDRDDLFLAVAFKAIELSAVSQIRERDDKFSFRVDYFAKAYQDIMKSVKLPYDSDRDGIRDQTAKAGNSFLVCVK